MTPDTLFTVCSTLVLPGWALLLVAPRWKFTRRLVGRGIIPLTLAVVYLGLIGSNLAGAEGGFGSLDEVARVFSNRWLLLAGWVHYLAFDLLVGSWESLDARRVGVPHALVVPCLILTFLLGPIGFLLYVVVRGLRTGRPTWEIA